jgi:hypothetical protein
MAAARVREVEAWGSGVGSGAAESVGLGGRDARRM